MCAIRGKLRGPSEVLLCVPSEDLKTERSFCVCHQRKTERSCVCHQKINQVNVHGKRHSLMMCACTPDCNVHGKRHSLMMYTPGCNVHSKRHSLMMYTPGCNVHGKRRSLMMYTPGCNVHSKRHSLMMYACPSDCNPSTAVISHGQQQVSHYRQRAARPGNLKPPNICTETEDDEHNNPERPREAQLCLLQEVCTHTHTHVTEPSLIPTDTERCAHTHVTEPSLFPTDTERCAHTHMLLNRPSSLQTQRGVHTHTCY